MCDSIVLSDPAVVGSCRPASPPRGRQDVGDFDEPEVYANIIRSQDHESTSELMKKA